MLMIFPPALRASMCRPAARDRRNTLERFTSSTSSQSSSVCPAAGSRRMMPALLTRMSSWPNDAMASAIRRSAASRSPRFAVNVAVRRPAAALISCAASAGCVSLACSTTSAPAAASAVAIPFPSPREAPVTSATLPSRRNRSSDTAAGCALTGPMLHRQEVLAQRREDVDQHDFFVEHRGAVRDARRQLQHVALLEHALLPFDDVAHASALDHRDLLVRVRMHGGHGVRRDDQPAHHHAVAPEQLTLDPLGDPHGGNRGPVGLLHVEDSGVGAHRLSARPASRPEGVATKSGCTFTTPYCRSTSSRRAAIIQRKLMGWPGAPTLGWYPAGMSTTSPSRTIVATSGSRALV